MARWRRACASGATGVDRAVARFARGTGAGSEGFLSLEGVEAARAVACSVFVFGTVAVRRRRGFADVLGVCALGWGFGEYEAASAFSSGPRTAGRALPHSTLMFLRADRVCCGGYHGVCFSLWSRRFVGGSLYLYDVEGSTRRCWTGSLVSLCAIPSRRVFIFWWLAACCGLALRYDMWAARCPLEERACRGAGRSRRRARGDGVLVWSGVALPCLCGGSRRQVSSREGEGATASYFLGRSLAPLV